MPGGYGTLDEFFEAITLIQTEKIQNFPVIVIGKEYHQDVLEHVQRMKNNGTISPEDEFLFSVTDSIEEAVQILRDQSINRFALRHEEPKPFKWLFERRFN
jgi:predicted Rossmann-fold nucleotide-binding protein